MSSGIGKYDLHKREMLEMRGPFLTSIFITPEGRVQCWTVSIYNGIQGSAFEIIKFLLLRHPVQRGLFEGAGPEAMIGCSRRPLLRVCFGTEGEGLHSMAIRHLHRHSKGLQMSDFLSPEPRMYLLRRFRVLFRKLKGPMNETNNYRNIVRVIDSVFSIKSFSQDLES